MRNGELEQLEKALHVSLPRALSTCSGLGEFDEPIAADGILDSGSGMVWGGQMLPDSIPFFGNGAGDVLLLRFAPDGQLRGLVEWQHEGGLWHPSGLLAAYPSRTAELRSQTEGALRTGLETWCREHGGQSLAERLSLEWQEVSHWPRDPRLVPDMQARKIEEITGKTRKFLLHQDWSGAMRLASQASELDQELAWPCAVLGTGWERQGDAGKALEWYRRGLDALGTTASFTETWAQGGPPYCALRMRALSIPDDSDPRCAAIRENGIGLRQYWTGLGEKELAAGRPLLAYDRFFRAGWDDFFTNDMDQILSNLATAARAMGSRCLTALAELHLSSRT